MLTSTGGGGATNWACATVVTPCCCRVGLDGQQPDAIAGHQVVVDCRLLQTRISDAGLFHKRRRGGNLLARERRDRDRRAGIVGVGERRGGLAGAVVQQRGGVGDAPRVGVDAIQDRRRHVGRLDRALGKRQIVVRVAVVIAEQTLHAVIRRVRTQGNDNRYAARYVVDGPVCVPPGSKSAVTDSPVSSATT